MSWYLILKLTHMVSAIALLAGLIGRWIVRTRLPGATNIQMVQELLALVGRFDEAFVVRGSQLTLVTGLLAWWAGRWPLATAGHPSWVLVAALLFLTQIPLVIWVFLPHGRVFGKVFQEAIIKQEITGELRAALADPAVRAATIYEFATNGIMLFLMVVKPF